MKLKIYEDSKNYTGIIVKLSNTFSLPGLDNLVGTSVFGNTCLIPKTYSLEDLYVFFPSGTELSAEYLAENDLYREPTLNRDPSKKGYFETNGRIKAIKFKGNKSTGVIMPISSIYKLIGTPSKDLKIGDEFNEINESYICKKYIIPIKSSGSGTMKSGKILDEIIDSRMFPEHIDTSHLLKNLDKLKLGNEIIITSKLHGTSARVGHALIKRKLKWYEKIAKKVGVKVVEEEYSYVVGSRRVVKSINFNELKNKQHFYDDDLWTMVSKIHFKDKLNKGEHVYFEIVGKDKYPIVASSTTAIYSQGVEIQKGYSYGFNEPKIFVYRITNINSQGIEIDLSWKQLRKRCEELGIETVPIMYEGNLSNYLLSWVNVPMTCFGRRSAVVTENETPSPEPWKDYFEKYLIKTFLDKPSLFDPSIIEEGICVRVENYPTPNIYKLKSPLFLIHESNQADKQISDLETEN